MKQSTGIISVVVISFNGLEFIDDCLASITSSLKGVSSEILVVDNYSRDGTPELIKSKYPHVILIANSTNAGFAQAVNQGLKSSRGEYVLILNQDTRIRDRAIVQLAEKMRSNDQIGAIGPCFVGFDGQLQKCCRSFPGFRDLLFAYSGLSRLFPESRLFSNWKMGWFDHKTEKEVDQPMGAALMVRRQVIERIGGFDESFGIFFNDVDFCHRVKKAGFINLYFPSTVIEHYGGGSTSKMKPRMVINWHRAMFRYLKKYNRGLLKKPLLYFWGSVLLLTALPRAAFHGLLKRKLF